MRITARPSRATPAATPSPRWSGWLAQLPRGFGYEWTGQSLQEKQSGSQAPFLLALSVLVVFLLPRGALRELDHPALGAARRAARHPRRGGGRDLRGLPNDVYFKVGLITIIGLAAKNAILIIEFAKDLREQGKPLLEATIEAATCASGRS